MEGEGRQLRVPMAEGVAVSGQARRQENGGLGVSLSGGRSMAAAVHSGV
jgi:hypothetical protein